MADVLKVSAEKGEGKISFSGTMEEDVLAVSCSLRDKEGEEIDFNSVEAEDGRFSGEFLNVEGGETVVCANYDGGAIVSATVVEKGENQGGGTNEGKNGEDKNETEADVEEGTVNSSDTGLFTVSGGGVVQGVVFGAVIISIIFCAVLFLKRGKKEA